MNYGELKQFVASRMHRIDLDEEIPSWIEFARQRINRDLRVREMILQAPTTPTDNPFPLPADFLEMRDIYYSGQNGGRRVPLQLVGRRQLDEYVNAANGLNQPGFYSIDGLSIETAPGGIGLEFTQLYYAKQPELVADVDTNLTMDVYGTIWIYASLIEGHNYTQDLDLQADAIDKYTSEVSQANTQSADSESGASLQMKGASSWV